MMHLQVGLGMACIGFLSLWPVYAAWPTLQDYQEVPLYQRHFQSRPLPSWALLLCNAGTNGWQHQQADVTTSPGQLLSTVLRVGL